MGQDKMLHILYDTAFGRIILKGLVSRKVSRLCGKFLDMPISRHIIPGFVKKHNINMSDYTENTYRSFNAFFCRNIRKELRPISDDPCDLIAPCDGFLSVYPISEGVVLPIKQSIYTVNSLLAGSDIAKQYQNGLCLVFRLCVDHYHHYCYFDTGSKGENVFIPGRLHTVRPIALEKVPVFIENCREYTVMDTQNFGAAVQIEVGAMLVGKIKNHELGKSSFKRGDEKGMFLYGGSTIILLLQKGRAELLENILKNSEKGLETEVHMGEVIGKKGKTSANAES